MKRTEKGTPGYLDYKRKVEMIRTIVYFGIVAAIILLGYIQTGTKLNLLTVVGVVGCLPSSKALVGVIARFPYRSISPDKAKEIAAKTTRLTVCYDLILTSREKIMPVECLVISGHHIYGYAPSVKVKPDDVSRHIRAMLEENKYSGMTIKVLEKYNAFLARAEGLDRIAEVEQEDTKETELNIRNILLNVSM